jgi:hypothetical protein
MADSSLPSASVTPYYINNRDFTHYSDHVTVWVDQYIGVKDTYKDFKSKFDNNIQVLKSHNKTEIEIDDDTMLMECSDPEMLKKLSDDCYCLKYFSEIDKALEYIRQNCNKKIFFISSGTIGREVVPQIADLAQIHGIYIFCMDISKQTDWAAEYAENISAMLVHQDDLLKRLTRDIADYLEKKGDRYKINNETIQAKNCYAWTKKLLIRAQNLGDAWVRKPLETIDRKLSEIQSFAEAPTQD